MSKILIIEDEKNLNEAYQIVLKKAKHKVWAAYNGQEGLDIFKAERPDLVLLDLRMPKMSGVEFLKLLNPAKNYPEVKIIVFSNYDDQREVAEAIENGASRYMLKAWSSPAELIKLVKETLEQKADS
jgi:DNA-binding response OmpR family regulator